MAIGDILQFKIFAKAPAQLSMNTVHYIVTNETAGGATLQELVDDFDLQMKTSFRNCLSTSAELRGFTVQRIWPMPVSALYKSTTGAGAGTVAGQTLPTQVSGIITLRTLWGGRKNRGRVYVPFPSENSMDANADPTAAYKTLLQTFGGVLTIPWTTVGAGGTTTIAMVLKNKDFPATPPIFQAEARSYFATQRRRGQASGPDALSF